MPDPKHLYSDFEICRNIQKNYGKTYYFATKFFPEKLRLATWALYAFFRIPDQIVDDPEAINEYDARQKLLQWRKKWRSAYKLECSDEPVLEAAAYIFHKYHIPYEYSEDFFSAMITDTEKKRYDTYEELEQYMYGSAAVVGLMLTHVIGFKDRQSLDYAEKLGYAMQLTNFLRDIREDFALRDRIYMPLDELSLFNLSPVDIANHNCSADFKEFMKFQVQRTRALYKEGEKGIYLLNKQGRFAVSAASVLYGAILDKIAKKGYDVFSERAYVSGPGKCLLLAKVLFKHYS